MEAKTVYFKNTGSENTDEVFKIAKKRAEELGIKSASLTDLKGGTPQENAALLRRILDGEKGPWRDVVVMNGAAALVAGNLATGLQEGVRLAREAIDSGAARAKLDELIKLSQSLK